MKNATALLLFGLVLAMPVTSLGQSIPPATLPANSAARLLDPRKLWSLQQKISAMQSRTRKIPGPIAAPLVTSGVGVSSKVYRFASVDYPGADLSIIFGSNGKVDIGIFTFNSNQSRLSFTHSGIKYQIFKVPGLAYATPEGINSLGVMAGYFLDPSFFRHGFIDNAGTVTTVDYPGSTETILLGINDAGDVVGSWNDAAGYSYAFVQIGGVFSTIDYPGATYTQVQGINSLGQVVGDESDGSTSRGFIWSNGAFTSLDFPGAASTFPTSINDAGKVAGFYTDAAFAAHGFLYQNSFTTVDVVGAIETYPYHIDNYDRLYGAYRDTQYEFHGFSAH